MKVYKYIDVIDELYSALGTSNKPHRDKCGDWNITGTQGFIYSDGRYGQSWYLFTGGESWPGAYKWSFAKSYLPFMTLHHDGDDEGVLSLGRLPTPAEADKIRKILGLRKKKALSIQHLTKLIEGGEKFRFFRGSTPRENTAFIH